MCSLSNCLYWRGERIAQNVVPLRTVWDQMRGVIGRRVLPGVAYVLPNCPLVHTAFVREPLTVAFCRAEPDDTSVWRVLSVQTLAPWRVSAFVPGATLTIEMDARSDLRTVVPGDVLLRVNHC